MLEEYTLYLDESTDDNTNTFCVAGCIIKNSQLSQITNDINSIKRLIWSDSEIQTYSPVLHSTEFNTVFKNRKNPKLNTKTKGAYTVFNTKSPDDISLIYKNVYVKLSALIKNHDIVTLCCIFDKKKLGKFYSTHLHSKIIDDLYDIAIQELIECFTHFLCSVNGIGSIVYEARNNTAQNHENTPDNKMFHNFFKIKANSKGISMISSKTIYERIRNLNIIEKRENNTGLQIADFIAFNYIKWYLVGENDRTDFMKRIHKAAYNGSHLPDDCDLRSYWGVRVFPTDFIQIGKTKSELSTLKKAYSNLKDEKRKIAKQLAKIKNEKRELADKLKDAEEELEKLSQQLKATSTSSD